MKLSVIFTALQVTLLMLLTACGNNSPKEFKFEDAPGHKIDLKYKKEIDTLVDPVLGGEKETMTIIVRKDTLISVKDSSGLLKTYDVYRRD